MDRIPLDAAALRAETGARWATLDVVDEVSSTNADLLARVGAADRSVLVAEHQSAGRGRFARSWVSPPRAGLTFSALFRPSVPRAQWGWLPLLAGVALAEGILDASGLEVELKWPNDVLTGGAKLAGVLAQTSGDAVVIGIGCNVTTTAQELPVESATSLALVGVDVDRARVLVATLARLDARIAQWVDCVGDAEACGLAAAYRERCTTIGARVRVSGAGDETLEGDVLDVDADAHLVLQTTDSLRTVAAGDVEHLRPA